MDAVTGELPLSYPEIVELLPEILTAEPELAPTWTALLARDFPTLLDSTTLLAPADVSPFDQYRYLWVSAMTSPTRHRFVWSGCDLVGISCTTAVMGKKCAAFVPARELGRPLCPRICRAELVFSLGGVGDFSLTMDGGGRYLSFIDLVHGTNALKDWPLNPAKLGEVRARYGSAVSRLVKHRKPLSAMRVAIENARTTTGREGIVAGLRPTLSHAANRVAPTFCVEIERAQ